MALRTPNAKRELAYRASNGIEVRLLWNRQTNQVTVRVYNAQWHSAFELVVDGQQALDAYHHPFAYATRKRLRDASTWVDGLAA